MKLKTYAEIEQIHKENFYKQWYGGLKDQIVNFIEYHFVDIEGFNVNLTTELYDFALYERIWAYKFLRSELWDMGFNLMKEEGYNYRLFKRKKEDKYSKFLNYVDCNMNPHSISSEILQVQIITGKTYDEARKIFNAAINIKPKKEEKNKKTINVVNIATDSSSLEEVKKTDNLTEVLEKTLATDDSK